MIISRVALAFALAAAAPASFADASPLRFRRLLRELQDGADRTDGTIQGDQELQDGMVLIDPVEEDKHKSTCKSGDAGKTCETDYEKIDAAGLPANAASTACALIGEGWDVCTLGQLCPSNSNATAPEQSLPAPSLIEKYGTFPFSGDAYAPYLSADGAPFCSMGGSVQLGTGGGGVGLCEIYMNGMDCTGADNSGVICCGCEKTRAPKMPAVEHSYQITCPGAPTQAPTVATSDFPSVAPSEAPSSSPSVSVEPSALPSESPSELPSDLPSVSPSDLPSEAPSDTPSDIPSDSPSDLPSDAPSDAPSDIPSDSPSVVPSDAPSDAPSDGPSESAKPSTEPSMNPSSQPSSEPSDVPSNGPTLSIRPSYGPTKSAEPSSEPSLSAQPSDGPSESAKPSTEPSSKPSNRPSSEPSLEPSVSAQPSAGPSAEICLCDNKCYVANEAALNWTDHQDEAILQGCQLASISDGNEKDSVIAAATSNMLMGNNSIYHSLLPLAWVGLDRLPVNVSTWGEW